MKTNFNIILVLIVLGLANMGYNVIYNWKVKEDNYSIKISGTKIDGTFTGLKSTLLFDPAHPEACSLSATVDATTLSTGFFLKTKHALSEEALDAKRYPTIRFQSDKVVKNGNFYEASGKLTLKGVTKNISIPFTYSSSSTTGTFRGTFKINPKDYHIDRHGTPDVITIVLNIPVTC
jgi:polyisoprenoid-binding protein YceI